MRVRKNNIPVGFWLCVAVWLCTTGACEDKVEMSAAPDGDAKSVEVAVSLGFAPEENAANGDNAVHGGKSAHRQVSGNGRQAFHVEHQTEVVSTRAGEITTPDGLYALNVFQFDQSGTQLDANGGASGKTFYQSGKINAGSQLTFSLTQSDDCQLVIIACGEGASSPSIGDKSLADLQAVSFSRDVIDGIPTSGASQAQMNKMPYVLHLQHVKVTSDGKLQSPDIETTGAYDVRLLLKRLAAKVTVKWNYNVTVGGQKYTLKQLLLQDIPLDFNYIPKPDTDGVYPNIMDQYTALETDNYDVSANQSNGTYSFWVPANVRKDNPAVSSDILRIKANASAGSSYLTFVAVNNADIKKKFNYRIYLGNEEPANFSIKSNTDYIYDVRFTHTAIPTSDRRVTYIDPIPASESNDNLVPTANCFMVAPGGAFCFDPFMFRINGTDTPNTQLKGWVTSGTTTSNPAITYGIKYVKLLWQFKEDGDVGEPVMGVVNSEDDHTNIVDIKDLSGNGLTTAATAEGQCRIYCRVASGTTGGSGLIAAYDTNDEILWSWHVWVTDYNPDAVGSETVLTPANKRKIRMKSSSGTYAPIMDRNLGAYTGEISIPSDIHAASRTQCLHFQKGRKDPLPGSYTSLPYTSFEKYYDFTITADRPPKNIMNRYRADGVHVIVPTGDCRNLTLRDAYKHPIEIVSPKTDNTDHWCSDGSQTWNVTKTFDDPSPAGWRVPTENEIKVWADNNAQLSGGLLTKAYEEGGLLLQCDNTDSATKTFMRFSGYPFSATKYVHIGDGICVATVDIQGTFVVIAIEGHWGMRDRWAGDALIVRCIQEKTN